MSDSKVLDYQQLSAAQPDIVRQLRQIKVLLIAILIFLVLIFLKLL